MAENEKVGRKFLYYDIGGAVLIGISVYFFYQTMQFAGGHNYVAGIISAIIGGFIFSAGIGLIKVSAAAKVTK
jgi:lipopolysaccharide export LptBFGC system permease protein LptF